MSEWPEVSVNDIKASTSYALATGPFGSSISSRFFQDHGVPVIRGSNLSEKVDVRFNPKNLVFISEEKAKKFERSIARSGDLVFTCWGTIGQVGLIEDNGQYPEYVVSNKQMKLTPDPQKADSLFLYYLFSGPEMLEKIINQAIGSSVPGFNLGQLRALKFRLPPLPTQRRIAEILGRLDDKIEVNRRVNRTLEAMVQALFKHHFVDFGPYQGELVGSEVGPIPQEWKIGRLSDICTTQYGYTESAKSEPIGPKFLRVMDINKQNWIEWETVPYCTIDDSEKPKYALKPGDILVARMADPGKSAIVEQEIDAIFASYLVRLKTQSLAYSYFVYNFLKSPAYKSYAEGAMSGSVQKGMNAKIIVECQLVIPPQDVVESFLPKILPLRQHIVINLEENRKLSEIREYLLPRLVSGELKLKL